MAAAKFMLPATMKGMKTGKTNPFSLALHYEKEHCPPEVIASRQKTGRLDGSYAKWVSERYPDCKARYVQMAAEMDARDIDNPESKALMRPLSETQKKSLKGLKQTVCIIEPFQVICF